MIYITGDTHREFDYRFRNIENNSDNMVIILGDAGINYYLDESDVLLKRSLSKNNFVIFCVQGNHEERPENIKSYEEIEMFGGKVFIEKEYPNLVFAKNGEVYDINGKSTLVIGGAYSVDKYSRIVNGIPYFKDEQLSLMEQKQILNKYAGSHVDVILSHTCPLKYIPTEALLEWVDQSKVDKSMEIFLDKIEETVDYDKWYCGHYHIDKSISKLEFLYLAVKDFEKNKLAIPLALDDGLRAKYLKKK